MQEAGQSRLPSSNDFSGNDSSGNDFFGLQYRVADQGLRRSHHFRCGTLLLGVSLHCFGVHLKGPWSAGLCPGGT